MDLFAGKTAVVTGGASGIGRALCQELGRRGAVLTVADRDAGSLERTVEALRGEGCDVKAAVLDVTDADAFGELLRTVADGHGRLDYLFNNAGIVVVGEAQNFSFEDWHRVIDVNLYGVVHGVMAAYPLMVRQGSGHIVNTASAAGLFPSAGEISYTASKYGVAGLSQALRVEGARYGVKVSVVCPGFIETPIYESARALGVDRERLFAGIPRMMASERCAELVLRRVEKNRAVIPVSWDAWLTWLLQRLSPGMTQLVTRTQIRKVRRCRTG
jgi:NAD(P)-dependent dehydrogenase (short-subunit alcohol dehydrogenase family)